MQELSEIFQLELAKYNEQLSVIRMNLAAQKNVFDAISETNIKYAETR